MRAQRSGIVLAATLSLFAACSKGGGGETPPPAELQADQLPEASRELTRRDVADLLRTTDIDPVGITITPDTGDIVLLDARRGVFVLNADRRFELAVRASDLHAQVNAASDFTDIAALGDNKFAITARNDGFLLDLTYMTFVSYFCYVPGFFIPDDPTIVAEQHTDSVGYDRTRNRIVAQPISMLDGVVTDTQVGTFEITGGEGEDWHPVSEPEFLAGGLAVDESGMVWLGRGNELCSYDLDTDTMTLVQTLERFGVTEIVGMAFDGRDLIVIDGADDEVVRIPAEQL